MAIFRNRMWDCDFCDEIANNMPEFANIDGDSYQGDYTMVAVIRALLGWRKDPKEIVRFTCYTNNGFENPNEDLKSINYEGLIVKNVADVSSFDINLDGYDRSFKVENFLGRYFRSRVWINRDKKLSVIAVEDLDIIKYRALQITIPAIFPWWFGESEHGKPTKAEMRLMNSINTGVEEFKSALGEMKRQYNFRDSQVKILMKGFEKYAAEAAIESTKNEIENRCDEIARKMDELRKLCKERDSLNAKLYGLKVLGNNVTDDLMEFCLSCNKITPYTRVKNTVRFIVETELENYDLDLLETIVDNDLSWCSGDIKILMEHIFINNEATILMKAAYDLDLGQEIRGIHEFVFPHEYDRSYPNPHIQHYSCTGDYDMLFAESLSNGDYVGCLNLMIASCESINFGDITVMDRFATEFPRFKGTCIKLNSGEYITPAKALEIWRHTDG